MYKQETFKDPVQTIICIGNKLAPAFYFISNLVDLWESFSNFAKPLLHKPNVIHSPVEDSGWPNLAQLGSRALHWARSVWLTHLYVIFVRAAKFELFLQQLHVCAQVASEHSTASKADCRLGSGLLSSQKNHILIDMTIPYYENQVYDLSVLCTPYVTWGQKLRPLIRLLFPFFLALKSLSNNKQWCQSWRRWAWSNVQSVWKISCTYLI